MNITKKVALLILPVAILGSQLSHANCATPEEMTDQQYEVIIAEEGYETKTTVVGSAIYSETICPVSGEVLETKFVGNMNLPNFR